MSNELELSEGMKNYFESGGDINADLAKELEAPPAAEPEPKTEPAQAAVEPSTVEPPTGADDEEVDDEPAPAAAKPGEPAPQPEKQRRRVSRREFDSERQARQAAETRLREQEINYAKVAERLTMLQEALREPAPEEKPQERPDPERDIFAYTRYLEEQLNTVTSKVNTYEEQITQGREEMEGERRYFDSLNNYAGTNQNFVAAYNYLLRSRAAELVARAYNNVTEEQLRGIMDGRMRVPQPITEALRQEERELYRNAFEQNRDPAATIYQYATMRGFRPPEAAKPAAKEPATPAAGTPGTPLGGTPAPAASAGGRGAPTATEVVAQIQRGQQAASSLSKTGGVAPDTQLTPEVLANMSDKEFERLFNELQASDDKDKLRQLFGA